MLSIEKVEQPGHQRSFGAARPSATQGGVPCFW
jgi:hypothetical protein